MRRGRADSINPNFDESLGESFPNNLDISRARTINWGFANPIALEVADKSELEGLTPLYDRLPTRNNRHELIDWKSYFHDTGCINPTIFGFIDGRLLLGWEENRLFSFVLQST